MTELGDAPLDPVDSVDSVDSGGSADSVDDEPWPIGFMILVGLAALYLAIRLVQMAAAGIRWVL